MSPAPGPSGATWPPKDSACALPNLSIAIGRGFGTVVVRVEGELTASGSQLLEGVLTDLIEGQGNRTVVVDLEEAVVETDALAVFVAAARQARRHGTNFTVKAPPPDAHDALRSGGHGDLLDVVPRGSSAG